MSGERENAVRIPPMREIETEIRRARHGEAFRKAILSTMCAVIVIAAIATLIATFVLPVMQISGSSMDPTISEGDTVVLFKTESYKTGDLCAFSWNNKTLIKRVIAVSGDWVEIDADGTVRVNGIVLDEPYVREKGLGECDITFPYQVPENSCFVMGDKRLSSVDSRSSVIGSVSMEQMIGRIFLRVSPPGRFGLIK